MYLTMVTENLNDKLFMFGSVNSSCVKGCQSGGHREPGVHSIHVFFVVSFIS